MLSGAIGFQILARRLGVEIGKTQFSHIEGVDDNEIKFLYFMGLNVSTNLTLLRLLPIYRAEKKSLYMVW